MTIPEIIIALIITLISLIIIFWLLFYKFDILKKGEKCIVCENYFQKINKIVCNLKRYPICDDCYYIAELLVNDFPDVLEYLDTENMIKERDEVTEKYKKLKSSKAYQKVKKGEKVDEKTNKKE